MTTSARTARPAGRRGAGDPAHRQLLVSGLISAAVAAGVGLAVLTILAVIGWIAAPRYGFGLTGVLRTAAVFWLVAHHVTVRVSGAGQIGMLPLGLVLLPGALLWRAGSVAGRRQRISEPGHALAVALAIAIPYALLAGLLAIVGRSRLAAPSVPQAVIAGFLVAVVAAGFGAARALAPWAQVADLIPAPTRAVLVGAAGSVTALAVAGSVLTAVVMAGHVRQFTAVNGLLGPGLVGAGLLLLAEIAYLPNAVIWAIAYMLGPGFAVGTGTIVDPSGSALGPLPAFPLLTALPQGSHSPGPAWLAATVYAVPYLAGAAGGLLVARVAPTPVLDAAPIRGFWCGALAGGLLGVLAAFSGGPLGSGRLASIGPSAWQVAVVGGLEIGISAAVVAAVANWRRAHARWPAMVTSRFADSWDRPAGPDPRPGAVPRQVAAADDDEHTIYLDRWAGEQANEPRRPRGPSVLP